MTDTALESLLRRDRAVIAGALAVIVVACWIYIAWLAAGMDRGATMDMGAMMAPALAEWSAVDAVLMLTMWSVMMVGMMLPSAAPMILLYGRVGRQAAKDNKAIASSIWFAAGYAIAWIGFSVLATAGQWALERAALLTPMLASASLGFGAAILLAAGLYQWTPLKDICLAQCQTPLVFIQRHGGFRRDAGGAVLMGVRHGAYCVGCCWALMALLFVGGVMNLLWIAAIAAFVLAEKVTPGGRLLTRLGGGGLIIAGLALAARSLGA